MGTTSIHEFASFQATGTGQLWQRGSSFWVIGYGSTASQRILAPNLLKFSSSQGRQSIWIDQDKNLPGSWYLTPYPSYLLFCFFFAHLVNSAISHSLMYSTGASSFQMLR